MGYRPVSRMDALLEELCARHGWCLREDDRNALVADPPREREAVVDSIIRAEFGDSAALDRDTRAWLTAVVEDWLFDPDGRGARSGLSR
jgi:hypothetical protein